MPLKLDELTDDKELDFALHFFCPGMVDLTGKLQAS